MCLITWNWQPGTDPSLLLIANRDEYYARPTLAMHWWDEGEVLAGKDLIGGGTWLGVTRAGRMAALTNYRDPQSFRADAPSRGGLVADFLKGSLSSLEYLRIVSEQTAQYNPFNLLVFDGTHLLGLESRHSRVFSLEAGIGGVSNADFYSPWPKLEKTRSKLKRVLDLPHASQDPHLWDLLANREKAADDELPDTGIPKGRERDFSAPFIVTPDYGTRASTVLKIRDKGFWVEERRYDITGLIGASEFSL